MEAEISFEPTLESIIDSPTIKWIFVGGKGGVGKTTVSSCVAITLATRRQDKKILIVSTDPAHNLSDAFDQKFSGTPLPVNGMKNLDAMEINPSELVNQEAFSAAQLSQFKDMLTNFPGIDEAATFIQLLKSIREMKYDVVVFDTAPTGHTLRFLALPSTLNETIKKLIPLSNRFSGVLTQILRNFNLEEISGNDPDFQSKLEDVSKSATEITDMFKNEALTTFIPVMIPEFLSLYETERLIQELFKLGIDVNSIVINQILYPPSDSSCNLCTSRSKMQKKYVDQAAELYEDFHVVHLPIKDHEIRGISLLTEFSTNLVDRKSVV